MNILAIGAHPDDIELGCGGSLLKATRAGHKVFMYVATRGGASGDPEQRCKELMTSAKYIGVEVLWIDDFEDTKLTVGSKLINHVEYFIHKVSPDIIFTHSQRDYHHDHRAVAECTLEASRFNQNVLAYEIPVTKDFNPQVYYNISDVIDEKVELVKIFWSQKDKMFTRANAIKGLAQFRALQSRLNGAITAVEGFEVEKLCFSQDFRLFKMPQSPLPGSVIGDVDTGNVIEFVPELRDATPVLQARDENRAVQAGSQME